MHWKTKLQEAKEVYLHAGVPMRNYHVKITKKEARSLLTLMESEGSIDRSDVLQLITMGGIPYLYINAQKLS